MSRHPFYGWHQETLTEIVESVESVTLHSQVAPPHPPADECAGRWQSVQVCGPGLSILRHCQVLTPGCTFVNIAFSWLDDFCNVASVSPAPSPCTSLWWIVTLHSRYWQLEAVSDLFISMFLKCIALVSCRIAYSEVLPLADPLALAILILETPLCTLGCGALSEVLSPEVLVFPRVYSFFLASPTYSSSFLCCPDVKDFQMDFSHLDLCIMLPTRQPTHWFCFPEWNCSSYPTTCLDA